MSPDHRISPLSLTLRPMALALALLTVTPAYAQSSTTPAVPAQTPPSASPQQTPPSDSPAAHPGMTAAPGSMSAKPTHKLPVKPKTHAVTRQAAVPPTSSANFLDQKLNLSDTHHVWHPSRKQLGITGTGGSYTVDSAKLTAYLTSIAPYVRRAPHKAVITVAGSGASNPLSSTSSSAPVPAKILPANPGIKLNVAASAAKIADALKANPNATHLLMSVQTTPVKSGGPDLSGIDARLAHFVTRFNPGEQGRTQTVRLAIKLIDNHVIAPGAVFSVNQTVGERTAERGFGKGIVFVDGKQETQLGGGMCQVATTLFNAALLANMKIVQRYQHIRTVPYVKPGEDATVYWGQKDFKFENDTQTPIYISYKTTATHCICDIYGKADPSVKVSLHDSYLHLGPRHYTAVFRRYLTKNGVKTNDYTVKSAYKWTPSLDYNI